MDKRIVGVYNNGHDAVNAIEDLKRQGYDRDDISVIAKDNADVDMIHEETGTKTEEGMAAGATAGGVLGGLTGLLAGIGALAIPGIGPILAAGPIAATLTGAALGASAGGLAGALIGMGIPEDEANRYESDVKSGKILVLVDPTARRTVTNGTDTVTGTTTGRSFTTTDDTLNGTTLNGQGTYGSNSMNNPTNSLDRHVYDNTATGDVTNMGGLDSTTGGSYRGGTDTTLGGTPVDERGSFTEKRLDSGLGTDPLDASNGTLSQNPRNR